MRRIKRKAEIGLRRSITGGALQEQHHRSSITGGASQEQHHKRSITGEASQARQRHVSEDHEDKVEEEKEVEGRNHRNEYISEPNAMSRRTLWRERGEKTCLVEQQIF